VSCSRRDLPRGRSFGNHEGASWWLLNWAQRIVVGADSLFLESMARLESLLFVG
jgi:hypothetical protein